MADLAFRLAVRGDPVTTAELHPVALARANTRAIQRAVTAEKKAVRALIIRAGLGQNIANAFRGVSDPRPGKPPIIDARGVLFSKATYKQRPGGRVDIIDVFRRGVVIRGNLWIPAKGTARNMTPGRVGFANLRTVKAVRGRGRPKFGEVIGYAFYKDSGRLAFIIVSAVKLKARLSGIDRIFAGAPGRLAARQEREYTTEVNRIMRRAGITRQHVLAAG